jgi:hypothetical protein
MNKHNLHGDIPKEHRELAKELLEMEDHFDSKIDLEPSLVAKGLVCISHDYYSMGDDDKGRDLLAKAEKVYPGYFDKKIDEHAAEDQFYKQLVDSLALIILETLRSIGGNAKSGS